MKRIFLIILLCIPLECPSARETGGKLYRWVDAQGKVHYSDTLPQDAVREKKIVYDKQRARKIAVIEKAKSREELARDARLKALREEEKKLLAEQMARNRALLRTYRSEEDLQLAHQGQIHTIDSRIKVLEANIKRQQGILATHIQKAAEIERNGRQVPKSLKDRIDAIRRQIHQLRLKIAHEEAAKRQLDDKFRQDLQRFRRLLQHFSERGKKVAVTRPDTEASGQSRTILSIAHCKRHKDCDRAWQMARIYVQTHTSTPIFINSPTIIHTRDPRLDDDIALTVARIREKSGTDTLFLDVRCKRSSVGQELCGSNKVREIRLGFPAFIREALNSTPQ